MKTTAWIEHWRVGSYDEQAGHPLTVQERAVMALKDIGSIAPGCLHILTNRKDGTTIFVCGPEVTPEEAAQIVRDHLEKIGQP